MKRRNLSHLKLTIFLILLAVLIFAAAALILKTIKNASTQVLSWSEAVEAVSSEPVKNVQPSLSVPTQITKIGDDYFLVDCYHNQILTSKTPDALLTDWYVMTDQINRGHTIAGDGTVYLADDTENNRVLIFEKQDGQFYLTQLFNEIGTRPHYVVYDETEKRFYVLSSMTGQLYVFYRPDPDSPICRPRKNPLCARAGSDLCPLLYNRRRRPVLCFRQSVDSAHPQKRPEDPRTFPGSCRNLRHDPADAHSGLVLHHRFHRPYRQSGLCDDPARAGFKRSFFRQLGGYL